MLARNGKRPQQPQIDWHWLLFFAWCLDLPYLWTHLWQFDSSIMFNPFQEYSESVGSWKLGRREPQRQTCFQVARWFGYQNWRLTVSKDQNWKQKHRIWMWSHPCVICQGLVWYPPDMKFPKVSPTYFSNEGDGSRKKECTAWIRVDQNWNMFLFQYFGILWLWWMTHV